MGSLIGKIKSLWHDKDERNLLINIAVAFAVKGLALLITMFSMPLYIRYFNNDTVLGVWYTILSILSWITVCDLGLGNGLRNRLTEALSAGDVKLGKKYVSSTYALLIIIIIPVLIVGSIVLCFLNFNSFFGVSNDLLSPTVLTTSIIILFNGIGINFVLKTVNSIIYAIQKSSLNNILSLVVSVLPLCYIAFFKGSSIESNLIRLSIVHVISINLPLLIATFAVFALKTLRGCIPSFKNVEFQTAKEIVGFGLSFFLAQIFLMFLMSTNELFITKMFSSADVVDYTIYYKLFTVIGSLFMLALTPLWSKVTKDFAEKKYAKIQKTNHFLYLIAAIAMFVELAMVVCLQWVINIWLQDEAIVVSYLPAFIFASFGGLYIFNVVLTTVANGIGNLSTQIVFYGIGALLKIPVCIVLKLWIDHWAIVVLYNAVVLLVFCIYQLIWLEKTMKLLTNKTACDVTFEAEASK